MDLAGETMGRTLDRSMLVGIGLIVALLIFAAGLNYWNTQQLNEDAGWVARTHEVLDLTTDVLRTVVDAETGAGYIVSNGRPSICNPTDALARLDERWQR